MGARPSKATSPPTPPSEARPSSFSSSWSDLPPELAGLVLRRFPSLADRVRFGSVCRHWHHATQQQTPLLPPVFPWTITSSSGRVQTIPDGEVHRLCSSKLATCSCSSENWLLMIGRASADDTESRNFLQNPLTGATLPLPGIGRLLDPGSWALYGVTKFIVCADNLVVVTIRGSFRYGRYPVIGCCRPGTSRPWSMSSQATAGDRPGYEDIAFNNGRIYAINESGDLFAQKVGDDHGYIVLSSVKLVIKGGDIMSFGVRRFLVVARGGGLLMVKWNCYDSDAGISVFQADLRLSRWSRLSSIGDQVLFVSQRCSKAVPAVSPNRDDYLRGNRIYFLDHVIYGPQKCCFGPMSCGMYDLRSNTYHSIVSDAFRANCIGVGSWFFPH